MKDVIIDHNQWWNTGSVEKARVGIKRSDYLDRIIKYIHSREIVKLIGVRRSGKTTLLYQTIDFLISRGADPKSICYVQMDDERLALYDKKTMIKSVIENYQELTGKNIEKDKIILIFDEIQYIENWESWLKTYYDSHEKIKFIVSGSSSTLIEKKSVEKLTGRQINITVYPLSFREFLLFNGLDIKISGLSKVPMIKQLEKNTELLSKRNEIKILLAKFLETGGFPQLVSRGESERKELLRQYFKDIVYRDIVRIFEIRNPETLENLAIYLLRHISGKHNFSSMAKLLNTSTDTAIQYFYFLTKSLLFYEVPYYSSALKSSIRKDRKIYCIDIGLRNALITEKNEGQAIENIVFNHLKKKYDRIFYWDNGHECDFVIKTYDHILPVEVKYREEIESKGIVEFMKTFKLSRGVIVTKDRLGEIKAGRKKILLIPAWMFLLVA